MRTMLDHLETWTALRSDRRALTQVEAGFIFGVLMVCLVLMFHTFGSA